ncbi:MAG: aminotransferase class III-fold pyridoxal phosphate-dependent enzyme [Bacteroidales bacterium]|nr:aminotransferase class III-fold pyridoxal phosphate-dependent enzyme [Bacteroidales bacterium]
MKLFDVYPLYEIEPVKAKGCSVWDKNGTQYLDFYGGHAVISIGHSHPHYIKTISDQLQNIGFYSNSVLNQLQNKVAEKLGRLSGYHDYTFFFCNSGAEANENALKLASFTNKRHKVLAYKKAFHGRTSGTVAVTDNPSIISPFNASHQVEFVGLDDLETTKSILSKGDVAAVIIEGIQGVGGIHVPDNTFLTGLLEICTQTGTLLILDEIQSGYGRSGKFFAHQFAGIRPDLITVAKGMGNGFPVAGVLISPAIEASPGLLGTTFGGNHLACAAAQSVLDVFENEQLIKNAATTGAYLKHRAREIKGVKSIRGLGLMIGLEFEPEIVDIRRKLLFDHHIFTGYSGKNTLRLLPPLCITIAEIDHLIDSLKIITENLN